MVFGLEIGMLIAGIITLAKGKFTLTKSRVVQGGAARLAGVVMVLPLPLAFAVGFVIGFDRGVHGKPVDLKELQGTLAVVELSIVAVCFLVALGIGLVCAQPPSVIRSPNPLEADALFRRDRNPTSEQDEFVPWVQPLKSSKLL
jgi:hypothetical protein